MASIDRPTPPSSSSEGQPPHKAEWTLYYHQAGRLKGRGEFIRLMWIDAGVSFVNSDEHMYGPNGMMDIFRGSVEAIDTDHGNPIICHPVFFPPAVHHVPANGTDSPILINQVAACMIYVGDTIPSYTPATAAVRGRTLCIVLNCTDYISEGRVSFHPIDNTMSYHDQKEQGDACSKEFTKGRMLKWLHHFNKVVRQHGPTQPVAGGDNITAADFALFHVLDATVNQFNTEFYEYAWDTANVPALKEFYQNFKARPNIKAYQASEKCPAWAGDSMM